MQLSCTQRLKFADIELSASISSPGLSFSNLERLSKLKLESLYAITWLVI